MLSDGMDGIGGIEPGVGVSSMECVFGSNGNDEGNSKDGNNEGNGISEILSSGGMGGISTYIAQFQTGEVSKISRQVYVVYINIRT